MLKMRIWHFAGAVLTFLVLRAYGGLTGLDTLQIHSYSPYDTILGIAGTDDALFVLIGAQQTAENRTLYAINPSSFEPTHKIELAPSYYEQMIGATNSHVLYLASGPILNTTTLQSICSSGFSTSYENTAFLLDGSVVISTFGSYGYYGMVKCALSSCSCADVSNALQDVLWYAFASPTDPAGSFYGLAQDIFSGASFIVAGSIIDNKMTISSRLQLNNTNSFFTVWNDNGQTRIVTFSDVGTLVLLDSNLQTVATVLVQVPTTLNGSQIFFTSSNGRYIYVASFPQHLEQPGELIQLDPQANFLVTASIPIPYQLVDLEFFSVPFIAIDGFIYFVESSYQLTVARYTEV